MVKRYLFVYPTDHVTNRPRIKKAATFHCNLQACVSRNVHRGRQETCPRLRRALRPRAVSAITIKPVGCLWNKPTMTFFVPVVSPILVASLPGIAVRRYLCSKDFWLTSTPKPLLQGSQNLLSKSLQWRSLAFPHLTRAWNTRTLTSRELGTKETENGGACTETSRPTQSGLRVERKIPG